MPSIHTNPIIPIIFCLADRLWRRRTEQRVPLAYLTSSAYWRDFVLAVGPGVLIPRPETELIIDMAAEAIDAIDSCLAASASLRVAPWVDLGTGSGALACGLAKLLQERANGLGGTENNRSPGLTRPNSSPSNPDTSPGGEGPCSEENQQSSSCPDSEPSTSSDPLVWAVDVSPCAARYASYNAQRLGLQHSVRVVQGSWYEPLRQHGVGKVAGEVHCRYAAAGLDLNELV